MWLVDEFHEKYINICIKFDIFLVFSRWKLEHNIVRRNGRIIQ